MHKDLMLIIIPMDAVVMTAQVFVEEIVREVVTEPAMAIAWIRQDDF